jgi:hypothetical protein
VAIVDLIRVDSPEDAGFLAAARPIYERHGQGHSGPPAPTRESVDPTVRSVSEADGRFECVDFRKYDWDQTHSALDYRTLMLSFSAIQMMEEDDRVGLHHVIESFIRNHFGGVVTRPLVVTVTTATLRRQ